MLTNLGTVETDISESPIYNKSQFKEVELLRL